MVNMFCLCNLLLRWKCNCIYEEEEEQQEKTKTSIKVAIIIECSMFCAFTSLSQVVVFLFSSFFHYPLTISNGFDNSWCNLQFWPFSSSLAHELGAKRIDSKYHLIWNGMGKCCQHKAEGTYPNRRESSTNENSAKINENLALNKVYQNIPNINV